MKVSLIAHTPYPDYICAQAAAICTDWQGDPMKALKGALSSGHESVAEHASFTFLIEGVSRALLAQLTRHRIASYSVQSQRYVNINDMPVVTPPSIKADDAVLCAYENLMEQIKDFYHFAVGHGIPREDARFATPQAACTTLTMTMNARELRHFFSLRCCNRAQWEIRALADEMMRLCKDVAPVLFRDAGPGCLRGRCPEGKKSCGKPRGGKENE